MTDKLMLAGVLIFLTACSDKNDINSDAQFEKFYLALEMDKFIAPSSPVELNLGEVLGKSEGVAFEVGEIEGEGTDNVKVELLPSNGDTISLNIPMNDDEAKRIFKDEILKHLSRRELEIGAEFYSSKEGLKIHQAIIEAEKAVNEYLNGE